VPVEEVPAAEPVAEVAEKVAELAVAGEDKEPAEEAEKE
jgi:hypothetical protein